MRRMNQFIILMAVTAMAVAGSQAQAAAAAATPVQAQQGSPMIPADIQAKIAAFVAQQVEKIPRGASATASACAGRCSTSAASTTTEPTATGASGRATFELRIDG